MTRSASRPPDPARRTPRILHADAIRSAVTLAQSVDAVDAAFRDTAPGGHPPPIGFDLPSGEVHVKAAHLGGDSPVVVKIASGYPGNIARGLPTGDGLMVTLDPETGRLLAVLFDGGWLTDLRTAAATAVATRHLTRTPPRRLALLGTGIQAGLTLHTLDAVGLLPAEVSIWGRDPERARRVADQAPPGSAVTVVRSGQAAVTGADVVVTVTAARAPVLLGQWLTPDALVIAVGADSPGKRECDDVVMRRASCLVVDNLDQAARLGELQHARVEQTAPARIVGLGEVLQCPDALPADGIRVCDLTGLGSQDAVIAALALAGA